MKNLFVKGIPDELAKKIKLTAAEQDVRSGSWLLR